MSNGINNQNRRNVYEAATNDPAYWQALGLNQPNQPEEISPNKTDPSSLLKQYKEMNKRSENELKEVQEERQKRMGQIAMLQGANQIASAIAQGYGGRGGTPDLSFLQQMADQKVKDVKESRRAQIDTMKQRVDEMALEQEVQKTDPNSQESEGMRQLALKALPEYENVIIGKSAKQIEDQLDLIMKFKKADKDTGMTPYQLARLEYLKERLDETKANRKLRKDKLEWQKDEKNELSDKQTEALTQLEESMDALDNLASQKVNIDTGPISAAQNWAAQKIGIDDPQKSAFRSSAIDAVATRIKALSGTAASDQERAFIMQTLPQMRDNDATFMSKLNEARKRIKKVYDRRVKNFMKQGKEPGEFQDMGSAPQSMKAVEKVRVKTPDGRVGSIPADKLQDAINRGFQVLD